MDLMIKQLIEKIAKSHSLTITQVEEIYMRQFEKVRNTINEGNQSDPDTFKSIRLPQFGKFVFVKEKWIKINKNNYEKRRKKTF
jgi:nucleoid DNA-binding protein